MQCGANVITSRDPALLELTGDAALHTSNITELSEALRSRLTLRGAARARAANYSWAKTARRTHEIYQAVVKRK